MVIQEDAQILATLLKHILVPSESWMNADDIEQLLQDIPVQPPVVVPVRTEQEEVAAGDLPPLDVDAAKVFSQSERILQHRESWQPDIYRHIPSYSRYMTPYPMPCHLGSYTWYLRVYTFFKIIYRVYTDIYFSSKLYDVIWRYRYITVYDGSWPSYVSIKRRFRTHTGHGY